jgi:hypothetical protein
MYDAAENTTVPMVQKLKPAPNGNMRLDMQEYCTAFVNKTNGNAYNNGVVNIRDNNVWGRFELSYSERWTGETAPEQVDGNVYYFVDAAKPIQSLYGQNLLDYLPFPSTYSPAASFLTLFDKPSYFEGYPFDLSFIYPDSIANINADRKQVQRNASGADLNTITTAIDKSKAGGVNRLNLSPVSSYAAGTDSVQVYIRANSNADINYYAPDYIEEDYFQTGVNDELPAPFDITERKVVKIGKPCGANPVYLCWRNPLGGWDYWLFDYNQQVSIASKAEERFNQEPDNIETALRRSVSLIRSQVERILCGAIVFREDFQGIQGIEASPAVLMLMSLNPVKWVQVEILPKGFKYETRGTTVSVEIELELPERYTVSN